MSKRNSSATARVTSRFQAVIPKAIRDQARIKPGDLLHYRVENGRIVVEKKPAGAGFDFDPFGAFVEWQSAEDDRAFRDL
ncbi:MAG: AbrB/MazE/SpoVT family DNA-binding domain-containing protein [Alphaproteobacteria bacterium]|nr:AbrB/MazE/SpoVT family DNA-binding domain-containing protein [Alphaproteobacteria bacterium]